MRPLNSLTDWITNGLFFSFKLVSPSKFIVDMETLSLEFPSLTHINTMSAGTS